VRSTLEKIKIATLIALTLLFAVLTVYVPNYLVVNIPHENLIENPVPNVKITLGDIENSAFWGQASLEIRVDREVFIQRHFEEVFLDYYTGTNILSFWGFDNTTGYQPFVYKMSISEYAGSGTLQRVTIEGNMIRIYWGCSSFATYMLAVILGVIAFAFCLCAYSEYKGSADNC